MKPSDETYIDDMLIIVISFGKLVRVGESCNRHSQIKYSTFILRLVKICFNVIRNFDILAQYAWCSPQKKVNRKIFETYQFALVIFVRTRMHSGRIDECIPRRMHSGLNIEISFQHFRDYKA